MRAYLEISEIWDDAPLVGGAQTVTADELIAKAKELFHKLWRKGVPIRLMGVRLSELTSEAVQTNLFEDTRKKTELYKAIDDVKGRFGKYAVIKAGGMREGDGQ